MNEGQGFNPSGNSEDGCSLATSGKSLTNCLTERQEEKCQAFYLPS